MSRPRGPDLKNRHYPDLEQHEKHIAFLRQRSQARFRGEGWTITIEEFFDLWPTDLWSQRGRKPDEYCMTRKDNEGAWSKDNCMVISRLDHFRMMRGKI
jgi:hypothetical protein